VSRLRPLAILPLVALVLPGCDIFLPEDWGTLGSACTEDRHCQGGLWCYEGNCVGDAAECGDSAVEEGEQCDGGAVSVSCEDLGFTGGSVECIGCSFSTQNCGAPVGECTPGMSQCNSPEICVSFLSDLGGEWQVLDRCAKPCTSNAECEDDRYCTLTLPESEGGVDWACLRAPMTRGYGHRCLVDNECDHGLKCIVMRALAPSRTACAEDCNYNEITGGSGCEEFTAPAGCIENNARDFCGVAGWKL
jgi:hypothetical protein